MLRLARCAASPIWIALLGLTKASAMQKSYTLDYTPESSRFWMWGYSRPGPSLRVEMPELRNVTPLNWLSGDVEHWLSSRPSLYVWMFPALAKPEALELSRGCFRKFSVELDLM